MKSSLVSFVFLSALDFLNLLVIRLMVVCGFFDRRIFFCKKNVQVRSIFDETKIVVLE